MNLADLNIRQQLVIAWIAMGCTRKQIAAMLGLHCTRVDDMIKEIGAMLGFKDVARMTHYALLAGLVEPMKF